MDNRSRDGELVPAEPSGGVTRHAPGAPPPRPDPRVVQRYRAQVLRRLVAACADGLLDAAELAARSEAAHRAATVPDLAAVLADVPGPGQAAVAGPVAGRGGSFSASWARLAGGRSGPWPPGCTPSPCSARS